MSVTVSLHQLRALTDELKARGVPDVTLDGSVLKGNSVIAYVYPADGGMPAESFTVSPAGTVREGVA